MIIFLDFDGVLHPEYVEQAVPADVAFCRLPHVEAVLRDYPCVDIVISSTWRTQFSLSELQEFFSPDIAARIIDVTPVIENKYILERRECEIIQWMNFSDRKNEPWLALDDAVWQFKLHRDRLIVCAKNMGFDKNSEVELRKKFSMLL